MSERRLLQDSFVIRGPSTTLLEHWRNTKERILARQYAQLLELGHSPEELCIYEWPLETTWDGDNVSLKHRIVLGLKDDPPDLDDVED